METIPDKTAASPLTELPVPVVLGAMPDAGAGDVALGSDPDGAQDGTAGDTVAMAGDAGSPPPPDVFDSGSTDDESSIIDTARGPTSVAAAGGEGGGMPGGSAPAAGGFGGCSLAPIDRHGRIAR